MSDDNVNEFIEFFSGSVYCDAKTALWKVRGVHESNPKPAELYTVIVDTDAVAKWETVSETLHGFTETLPASTMTEPGTVAGLREQADAVVRWLTVAQQDGRQAAVDAVRDEFAELCSSVTELDHTDELKNRYPFVDHVDELLTTPTLGKPVTRFGVGMNPSNNIVWHEWDHEEPHLLIASDSGMGKSTLLASMLCQMLHNNHPADVNFWLIEPKTELQAYRDMPHVTRFCDATHGASRRR